MIPTMARQLVPIRNNPTDQAGETLRHPAECKERSLYPGGVKLLENPVGIQIDPPWKRVPVRPVNAIGERLDLKIVLYITVMAFGKTVMTASFRCFLEDPVFA
jgi:hypothetical protein